MKASERKIKDLFSEPNTFFSIPVYQRIGKKNSVNSFLKIF